MAAGRIFGNLSGGQINSALQRTGSNYQLPGNPYDQAPYAGNPVNLSADPSFQNDLRRQAAQSNGMLARAEKLDGGGMSGGAGGMMGGMAGVAGAMGGGGGDMAPPQTAYPRYASTDPYFEPESIRGQRHQQEGIKKMGALIGAIGSFYTGNVGGMASSASALRGGGKG